MSMRVKKIWLAGVLVVMVLAVVIDWVWYAVLVGVGFILVRYITLDLWWFGKGYWLAWRARRRSGAEAKELFVRSFGAMRKRLELKGRGSGMTHWWCALVDDYARCHPGEMSDLLLGELCEFFKKADELDSDDTSNLNWWGKTLNNRARRSEGEKAVCCYEQALEKFDRVLGKNKNDVYALRNSGFSLAQLAEKQGGKDGEGHFSAAISRFKQAAALKPNDCNNLLFWAEALANHSNKATGERALVLWREAEDLLDKIGELRPKDTDILQQRAVIYISKVQSKSGDDAIYIQRKVNGLNEIITQLRPKDDGSWLDWGYALLDLAEGKNGEERDDLLVAAKEKFLEAERLKEGVAAYDLACMAALLGDKDGCREWLTVGEKTGMSESYEFAMADADLAGVRGEVWFGELKWGEGNEELEKPE